MNSRIASPYRGLAAFDDSELDALLFFGRESETEIITANLMASRLTVLYGESGVGKSSLLRAGVAHHLRALREPVGVIVFDSWQDDPVAALERVAADAVGIEPAPSLADTLEACATVVGGDVYVILDQFEEYFLYHGQTDGPGTFAEEFPAAVGRSGLRASFLVALREDSLARLDHFKGRIPNLFGNYLRLDHLDRAAARSAILGPLEQVNRTASPDARVEIEPELVDAVLDDVTAGKLDLGQAGRGVVREAGQSGRIETPYLQLVMQRLWETEQQAGSRTLRLDALLALGGAQQIVRDHLDDALGSLAPGEKDVAAAVFNHLVTPSGTKIAYGVRDLANYAHVEEHELAAVLSKLAAERILRPVADESGGQRYEIYHDVLAEAVLAWKTGYDAGRELERERDASQRRHRRLLAIIGVGAALLAAMAALTVFAFTQRSEAQSQARKAQARALDASSVSQLSVDPELSLLLAVDAAERDRGGQAEDVLRRALLASRERAIFQAGGPLVAALFNPDGTRILTAGDDGKARVFDARSDRLLETLAQGAPITAAGWSPNGRRILTAGQNGEVFVWSTADGRRLLALRTGSAVRSASFGRGGTQVLVAGGHSVKLWRIDGRALLFTRRFGWPVTKAVFSPDGRRIAVIGNHPEALLLGTEGTIVRQFDQGDFVKDVAFSPDGRLIATAGRNSSARLWSVANGSRPLAELKASGGEVLKSVFSPDGKRVVTVGTDGVGRIWSVRSGALLGQLIGHTHFVVDAAFSPDGRYVVTSSSDRTARVWKVYKVSEFWTLLAGHSDRVGEAVFSPDGKRVLTASEDGSARLWDPQTQPRLRTTLQEPGPLEGATYVGRGDLILVAGPGRQALLIRASDGKRARVLHAAAPVSAAVASPDGALLAVAAGRHVTVLGRDGRRRLPDLVQPSRVDALTFSPDHAELVTGGSDAVARIWQLDGTLRPRALRGHSKAITDVAFSPDGTLIATSSRDRTARVWDARSGRTLHVLRRASNAVNSVDFSPDGRFLLTASDDADARLWNARTGSQVQLLRWHFGAVHDASFSPDGRWIVTGGPITAQLWQPHVRDPLFPKGISGRAGMTSVVFDPSSRSILSAGAEGALRSYPCTICGDLDELLVLARARLAATGRTLTSSERQQYGGR